MAEIEYFVENCGFICAGDKENEWEGVKSSLLVWFMGGVKWAGGGLKKPSENITFGRKTLANRSIWWL